jgi:hypothetical protein
LLISAGSARITDEISDALTQLPTWVRVIVARRITVEIIAALRNINEKLEPLKLSLSTGDDAGHQSEK